MILDISREDRERYFKNKEKSGVIYKITNLLNNDFYIGSSNSLYNRYYTHIEDIRKQKRTCVKLIRAVNKYGEGNFKFEILVRCTKECLLKLEQWYIDNLNPKYNIARIAGSNLGIKRSEEVKIKMSITTKEQWKDKNYRNYLLEKLSKNWKSGENHRMYGKTHSDETRKKLSESSKGNKSAGIKVINTITGETYDSVVDCYNKNDNIGSQKTFYLKLNGTRKNTTVYKMCN